MELPWPRCAAIPISDMWVFYSAQRCSIMTPNGHFHFTGVGAFPARSKHTQLGRGGRAQVGRAFAMRRGTHSSGAGARARAGLYIRHTQGARSEAALSAPRPCRGGRPASPRGLQVKAGAATSGRVSRVWGPRVAMGRSVGPWETWEALLATRGRPYSFRLRTASPLIQRRGSWAKLARVECTSSPPIEKRGSWGSRRV